MTGAPRIEQVQLNGADIEYDVRGSGAPVVFIHGAILSDGFVPVIEQTGIAENFQIVHYRRRGYGGSSRAVAGLTTAGGGGGRLAVFDYPGIWAGAPGRASLWPGLALPRGGRAPARR